MFNSSFSIRTLLALPADDRASPPATALPAAQPGADATASTGDATHGSLIPLVNMALARAGEGDIGGGVEGGTQPTGKSAFSPPAPAAAQHPEPAAAAVPVPRVSRDPHRRYMDRILDRIRYAPVGTSYRNADLLAMLPPGAFAHKPIAALVEAGYLVRARHDHYVRTPVRFGRVFRAPASRLERVRWHYVPTAPNN